MKLTKSELREGVFVGCACLSVVLLLVSNLAAVKLWDFAGLAMLDGGIVVFPIVFVLSDVILEIFGERRARLVVWLGFVMNLLMVGVLSLVLVLPAGGGWDGQEAYAATLGFVPRVVAGSLVSYIIAQLLNVMVFVRIRERTGQRWLWLRSLGSSLVANLANSLVFCGIVFGGVVGAADWWGMVGTSVIIMIGLEVVLTPVNYWVVGRMRCLGLK